MFLLQVIVKTSAQYELQQKKKKNKPYVSSIKKLNINFYSDVSDKAKVQQHTDSFSRVRVTMRCNQRTNNAAV